VRQANTQPSYNFLTGEPADDSAASSQQPLREAFRQSKADYGNEDLRAEIKTLKYSIANLEQDREFEKLRFEKEIRDIEKKAERDFKRAQVCSCSQQGLVTDENANS
jgi:hypothetical protein